MEQKTINADELFERVNILDQERLKVETTIKMSDLSEGKKTSR